MKTPTLETQRLILRPLSMDDAPAIEKYFNNWEIVKYTSAPWPLPENNAQINTQKNLDRVKDGKQISWTITLKENSETIGRIDYRFDNDTPDRGFWLAKPFQRKGFMTEAVISTQDYVFFEMKIDKIIIRNVKENKASKRVKEKSGAILIHEEEQSCSPHIQGPTQVWEVTRENWAKIRDRKI